MSRTVSGRSQRQAETLELFAWPERARAGSEPAQVEAARAGRGPATAGRGVQTAARHGAQTVATRYGVGGARRGPRRDYVEETVPASAPVYPDVRMDLAHQLAALKKFEEHPFVTNSRGEAVCPACGIGMLRAEEREELAPHFVCARSGLAWYGDPQEGLSLCLHPEADVAGRLCPAAT